MTTRNIAHIRVCIHGLIPPDISEVLDRAARDAGDPALAAEYRATYGTAFFAGRNADQLGYEPAELKRTNSLLCYLEEEISTRYLTYCLTLARRRRATICVLFVSLWHDGVTRTGADFQLRPIDKRDRITNVPLREPAIEAALAKAIPDYPHDLTDIRYVIEAYGQFRDAYRLPRLTRPVVATI